MEVKCSAVPCRVPAWEKLTEQIMAALGKELGIPADRTYIRYTATTDWGWNGGNF